MSFRQLCRKTFNYSICRYFTRTLREFNSSIQFRNDRILRVESNSCWVSIDLGQIRNYSKGDVHNSNLESEFDASEFCREHDVDEDEGKLCSKRLLYQNSEDVLLEELNVCSSSEMVLEIFNQRRNEFGVKQMVQTVILLWNCCKSTTTTNSSVIFKEFLQDLNNFIYEMSPDEITCSFLYLSKIGIDTSHPTIRNLILRIKDIISNDEDDVPLSALSRFSVAVNMKNDLHTILNCKEVIPRVIRYLKVCQTPEELRLITICMHNLVLMISNDILRIYKEKIIELIKTGVINKETKKCILKSLNILNFPHWSQENFLLIRNLLLLLEDQIENLSVRELETVFRIFQSQMEPALFLPKLLQAAEIHYQRSPTLEMFSYIAQFSQTHKRKELTAKAKEMLHKENFFASEICLPAFFRIIRSLKISDLEVCDKFWNGVLQKILDNPEEIEHNRIGRHCYRYMHFNNNLGGTYRHKKFEKAVCKILFTELTKGVSSVLPSKFARLSAFVLAYGWTEKDNIKFSDRIVQKIENMSNQFNILDCLFISRGMQIALELRFRQHIPPVIALQLVRIDNVLNSCAERHMQNNLNSSEINFIVRSFNSRKSSRKTALYEKAVDKYKTLENRINSRLIRDITFNLNSANYLIPEILEKTWEYVVKHRDYIMGDTVEKILNCSYNLGYIPTTEDALYWSAQIIKRDFEYMTGLSIVQACLALCYYKTISESLMNRVFCIDFIQRLEDEIQTCYSKATYPEKVLNKVMQLNRAVCLDYPEYQVPWFQQNYIEAQMSKKPIVQNRFHSEVKNLLISVVKDEKFLRCNHVTPYGYTVDFVIHLDKNRQPIPPPREATILDKITKVAILPLKFDSFCENIHKNMRGNEHLRMRHLEILGYKVIHISLSEWNAMYMNVPGAKVNYLKSLLQIQ